MHDHFPSLSIQDCLEFFFPLLFNLGKYLLKRDETEFAYVYESTICSHGEMFLIAENCRVNNDPIKYYEIGPFY